MPALAGRAGQLGQCVDRALVFDSFGYDIDVERSGELMQAGQDCFVGRVVGDFAYVGSIDLYFRQWKFAQLLQRRVSGPEIVQR